MLKIFFSIKYSINPLKGNVGACGLRCNLTENEFSIANNEFNTGEPLIYSSNGFTRIGIDTTTISGVSTVAGIC